MAEQRGPGEAPVEDAPAVIARVHDAASAQYRSVKKRKQAELAYRIVPTEDPALLKKKKKKVDNQASSVASRSKQEFIVRTFEAVVTAKMKDVARLVAVVRAKKIEAARKDEDNCELRRKVALLSEELNELKQGKSMHSTWPSCEAPTGESESLPPAFDEATVGLQDAGAEDGQGVEDSMLSAWLEMAGSQVQDGVWQESYKLDPGPCELPQAPAKSFKASLKPHEHDESFNPVA